MSCLSFLAPQGQIAALARDTVALSHKEYSTPKPVPKPQETTDNPFRPVRGRKEAPPTDVCYLAAWQVGVVRTVSGWSPAAEAVVTVYVTVASVRGSSSSTP